MDRFTYHHRVVDYFKQVASSSESVHLIQYGETYESRPLFIAVITHPDNDLSIEQIKKNHLISSGLTEGIKPKKDYAIVWLSYSVHGNESSSTEAAMKTLFSFANT